ncbi:MAG: translocation/assembly module TamB domain-containing protein [Fimbriimonas ginsengisoli]|nr:translocation/assembly module TamB domain-containing protein [Fimbriimonas ginsengisoli]
MRELDVRLTRLASGHLPITDYLPERGPRRESPAFRVTVERAAITANDLAGASPWTSRLVATNLVVEGAGGDWVASGRGELGGVGVAGFRFVSEDKEPLRLDVDTPGLALGEVWAHFATTLEARKLPILRDLQAARLRVGGRAQVWMGEQVHLTARVHTEGLNVTYRRDARADRAQFDGLLTESGAQGRLSLQSSGLDGASDGFAAWAGSKGLGATIRLRSASLTTFHRAFPTLALPQASLAGGVLEGWMTLDRQDRFGLDGEAQFQKVTVAGEIVDHPLLRGRLAGGTLPVRLLGGGWDGSQLKGFARIDVATHRLSGALASEWSNLGRLATRMGAPSVKGLGAFAATLGGTTAGPEADLRLVGRGSIAMKGRTVLGDLQGAGRWRNGELAIDRGLIESPEGALTLSGKVDKVGKLDASVRASGLALDALDTELSGTGAFQGRLVGTLGQPRLEGRAEVYGGSVQRWSIPFAAANILLDRKTLVVKRMRGLNGAGEIAGNLQLDLKSTHLAGSFTGRDLLLQDLFPDAEIAGAVQVDQASLSGRLDDPQLVAHVWGDTLIARNLTADRADARVRFDRGMWTLDRADLQLGQGSLSANGSYDTKQRSGTLVAVGNELGLANLASLGLRAPVDGTATGSVALSFGADGITTAVGQGQVGGVALNGTALGEGRWSLATQGPSVVGSLTLGFLDRYVEVKDVAFDREAQTIAGDLDVYNWKLADLYKSIEPSLDSISQPLRDRLQGLAGTLSAHAQVSGPWRAPDFAITSVQAEGLALYERPFGSLTASITRKHGVWSLDDVDLTHGESRLKVNGTIVPGGSLDLDGEISKLKLDDLAVLDERLADLSGVADVSFVAKGPVASPDIRASFRSDRLAVGGAEGQRTELALLLDSIHVTESSMGADGRPQGGIEAEGVFKYKGIAGRLDAQVPFAYPLTIPEGQPIEGRVRVAEDLAWLHDFYPGIDAGRTLGRVAGEVRVSGPIDALTASGTLEAQAQSLAFTSAQTSIRNATAKLTIKDRELVLDAQGESSMGGSANVALKATLSDLNQLVRAAFSGRAVEPLATGPTGGLTANKWRVSEHGGKDGGSIDATVEADLKLAGGEQGPLVSGTVRLENVQALLPSQSEGGVLRGGPDEGAFLDVDLSLGNRASVRSSTAQLSLFGRGKLAGRIGRPRLDSALHVASGTIRLPAGRIQLEPGGTIGLQYRVIDEDEAAAQLPVNLEGQTKLTAIRFGDTAERYDIRLKITGDLLKEGDLKITASSDPPDLSSDRILALLGEAGALESIRSDAPRGEPERQIREALTGFALPVVFEPVTARLASSLGLEYLSLEYNQYDLATVALTKTLAKRLSFEARRQVSDPPIGFRQHYDYKLVYRLPFRTGRNSRVGLSVGTDQDRPWKLAVEYGLRF